MSKYEFCQISEKLNISQASANTLKYSEAVGLVWSLYIASPQEGDFRLSGHPSDQGAGGRTRTRDRNIPAELRADSLDTVPLTTPKAITNDD
ncbi:hypothetical protein PoB_003890000 [Plakobranchus ocellatus]|uniref:Uncharacterized protein n=1 Tax=Plakobranchus ocellatus TaxID=259542 RepID=A0AAV4AYN2_9GAST|nr:hypothetical protein PoB_003890000 [Plakobranchus ocellatus]